MQVDGKNFNEHPVFSSNFSKYDRHVLKTMGDFEYKYQCTGFCMMHNVDKAVAKLQGKAEGADLTDSDRIATLTQWVNNGETVVLSPGSPPLTKE